MFRGRSPLPPVQPLYVINLAPNPTDPYCVRPQDASAHLPIERRLQIKHVQDWLRPSRFGTLYKFIFQHIAEKLVSNTRPFRDNANQNHVHLYQVLHFLVVVLVCQGGNNCTEITCMTFILKQKL